MRVPTRSRNRPLTVCPIAYAARNAITSHAKSALVQSELFLQDGREDVQCLAVDVIDDRREKEESPDVPAQAAKSDARIGSVLARASPMSRRRDREATRTRDRDRSSCWMCAENRRRGHRRDRALHARAHGLSLAAIRDDAEDGACARRIWRTLIEIAVSGTSAAFANHPSPDLLPPTTLVERDDDVGSSVSKSAGGSLNARWPFSPMPTNATSTGALESAAPVARQTSSGSSSPSRK